MKIRQPSRRKPQTPKVAGVEGGTETEGHLVLRDETGAVVHTSPPEVTESLRYMVARMRLQDGLEFPGRLGLTSTVRGEGVTFVCRSLALVLSQDSARRLCIVDLNWWNPSTWRGSTPRSGIAEVIRGSASLDEVLVPTGNLGLQFLPAGTTRGPERALLANSPDLAKVFVALADRFDYVLIDLPALTATSEALTLAETSGEIALVIGQGGIPESQIKEAVGDLGTTPLAGVIINRSASKVPAPLLRRFVVA